MSTRRANPSPYRLRALLGLGGVVAIFGRIAHARRRWQVVPAVEHASAMVESELRWYSAYYVACGLFVLRTATPARPDAHAVHAIAAAIFLGALGRAGAWVTVGKPHPFQRALLAIELALPPIYVIEQHRLGMRRAPFA